MAIITTGSLNDFSIRPSVGTFWTSDYASPRTAIGGDTTDDATSEASPDSSATDAVEFERSAGKRGLALARLRLDADFQSFLKRLLKKTSDVYFLAWCWDLSGQPTSVYPGSAATPESALIPMRGGDVREFMGAGTLLFPARTITAGLAVRLQIWESKQNTRDFGKTLSTVAEAIQSSELNDLLTVIATATSVPTATVAAIEQAALALGKVVGQVLQKQSDDHVDFYEGYFPATDRWTSGEVSYSGSASEIALNRF
jgi:hypothetical protein